MKKKPAESSPEITEKQMMRHCRNLELIQELITLNNILPHEVLSMVLSVLSQFVEANSESEEDRKYFFDIIERSVFKDV